MKNPIMLLLSAVLLAGCAPTAVERIAESNPIIPVRMTGDTAHLILTDYVPYLAADSALWKDLQWQVDADLEWVNVEGEGQYVSAVDLINPNNHIASFTIEDKSHLIAIPVLPNKPVRNDLISLSGSGDSLVIGTYHQAGDLSITAYVQNMPIKKELWQHNPDGSWTLPLKDSKAIKAVSKGRAYIRVFAEDKDSLFNDLLIPLQDGHIVRSTDELTRHDAQAQVLYSLMVDRFLDGNKDNNHKLNDPEVLDIVDYQGGDFAGITSKIEAGWFDSLGVNTLWISPITQNPWNAWGKYPFEEIRPGVYNNKFDSTKAYTKFSGYHGYWPIYITRLEKRFGTEKEFKALLDAAHKHNMNVVLDYVANHMHIESPTFKAHPDWHTDSVLPDGRRNFELWDEARLTTWFDVHIPTLDLEREEVCQPMTDSALYWLEHYDLDGFRHDACKHIPLNYWRTLGQKMATRFPGRDIWMIGETYGDPELIGSYVKTGMLPAQFDFNIYHTAIDVLGKDNESLTRMSDVVAQSLAAYGAHHTMGNISGNHDKCRFISLAGGGVKWGENDKLAGWTRHCGVTEDDNNPANAERMERAYKAAMLLEVINLTIPGVPCIYQGDEFGAAGANDPDNRGMMRFEGLSQREEQFRQEVEGLIKTRRHSMAMLYGDYIPVKTTDKEWIFNRVYMGEIVTVSINLDDLSYSITSNK